MHTRQLLEILKECHANDEDDYGIAVAVSTAVEADTREGLALVCDLAGLHPVAEAVRTQSDTVLGAIQSVVAGLVERHAVLAESLGSPEIAAAIRGA